MTNPTKTPVSVAGVTDDPNVLSAAEEETIEPRSKRSGSMDDGSTVSTSGRRRVRKKVRVPGGEASVSEHGLGTKSSSFDERSGSRKNQSRLVQNMATKRIKR